MKKLPRRQRVSELKSNFNHMLEVVITWAGPEELYKLENDKGISFFVQYVEYCKSSNCGKCSEISNTFLFLCSYVGYLGWNSQNACLNSKIGKTLIRLLHQ